MSWVPLPLDNVAHIIQVALAPAFLLSAFATLLNVFSTRLGRVADQVDGTARKLEKADIVEAAVLSRRLSHLRARSLDLDLAVVLASAGGCLTGISVLIRFPYDLVSLAVNWRVVWCIARAC